MAKTTSEQPPKNMSESTLEKIASMKAELAALEEKNAQELKEKLLGLAATVGLGEGTKGVIALINALLPYTKGKLVIGGESPTKGKAKSKPAKKGKRTKITDDIRKGIIAALKEGKTAQAVADKFGCSAPTVNQIKKKAGLVKAKKK